MSQNQVGMFPVCFASNISEYHMALGLIPWNIKP